MINLAIEACHATGLLGALVEWALAVIGVAGYFGALIVVMIENVLPFIPSEVILPALGMAASQGEFVITGAFGVIVIWLVATLASVLGATILFGICRLIGLERVEKLPFINREKVELADKWFVKHGDFAVFICRIIPVVRVLITVPSGISRMKFRRFILFTLLGTMIWNTVLVGVGAAIGSKWCEIEPVFSQWSHIVVVVGILLLVLAFYIKHKLTSKSD
jgi:membrane protein DedA with SNARE-associated domain